MAVIGAAYTVPRSSTRRPLEGPLCVDPTRSLQSVRWDRTIVRMPSRGRRRRPSRDPTASSRGSAAAGWRRGADVAVVRHGPGFGAGEDALAFRAGEDGLG